MDLSTYHASPREAARLASLMRLLPASAGTALDIGARDGFITRHLADRLAQVTALDLELPRIDDARIRCVRGDAAELPFPDDSFDLVFCAEVIEHIPSPVLERACREMVRVTRCHVLIGVPYRQDLRHGRTTCASCKGFNPPWGHVNSFDESRLHGLFAPLDLLGAEYVETAEADTNALSTWLMNLAGNPWGTYAQEEPCVHCGASLVAPMRTNFMQRGLARTGSACRSLASRFHPPHANWIHMLFGKGNQVTLGSA